MRAARTLGGGHPSIEPAPAAPLARALPVVLALLAVYVIWGSTYLAIRIGLESFPPLAMAAARFSIAGAILYAWLAVKGAARPTRRQWANAFVAGALLLGGGNGGVSVAEQWVPSGLGALGVAASPLWAVAAASVRDGRPRMLEVVGLALGLGGVLLLNAGTELRVEPTGAVLLLLASVSWGVGSAWSRGRDLPPGLMTPAAEMLAGGVLLAIASAALGERWPTVATTRSILALAYLAVFGSIVAFSAFNYLLRRVRPSLATSNAFVNPVVAVALGAVLAGESVSVGEVVAMATIVAGVGLVAITHAVRPATG